MNLQSIGIAAGVGPAARLPLLAAAGIQACSNRFAGCCWPVWSRSRGRRSFGSWSRPRLAAAIQRGGRAAAAGRPRWRCSSPVCLVLMIAITLVVFAPESQRPLVAGIGCGCFAAGANAARPGGCRRSPRASCRSRGEPWRLRREIRGARARLAGASRDAGDGAVDRAQRCERRATNDGCANSCGTVGRSDAIAAGAAIEARIAGVEGKVEAGAGVLAGARPSAPPLAFAFAGSRRAAAGEPRTGVRDAGARAQTAGVLRRARPDGRRVRHWATARARLAAMANLESKAAPQKVAGAASLPAGTRSRPVVRTVVRVAHQRRRRRQADARDRRSRRCRSSTRSCCSTSSALRPATTSPFFPDHPHRGLRP